MSRVVCRPLIIFISDAAFVVCNKNKTKQKNFDKAQHKPENKHHTHPQDVMILKLLYGWQWTRMCINDNQFVMKHGVVEIDGLDFLVLIFSSIVGG